MFDHERPEIDPSYWRERLEQYLNEWQEAQRDPRNFIYPNLRPLIPPPPVQDLRFTREAPDFARDVVGREYVSYTDPDRGGTVELDLMVVPGFPDNHIRLVDRDAIAYDMRRDHYDAEYHANLHLEQKKEARRRGEPTIESFNQKIRTFYRRTPRSPQLETQYGFVWDSDESPEMWLHSDKPWAVSFRLLMEHLSRQQRDDFLANCMFVVKGSDGNQYTISAVEYAFNVIQGARGWTFCTANYEVPVFDTLLTQKLMIETDIEQFMRIANKGHNSDGFRRGLARTVDADENYHEAARLMQLARIPLENIDLTWARPDS